MTDITEDELDLLRGCKTEEEWNDACDEIKRIRNGFYPNDWYTKVIASGLASAVKLGLDE